MMKSILLVGLGGGIGSILRYLSSVITNKYLPGIFPFGTFLVNIIGCLLIGILLGWFDRQQLAHPDMKLLLISGFCGGFTTFSTFSSENLGLLQSGNTLTAFLYIAASVLVGLFAVWLGLGLAK